MISMNDFAGEPVELLDQEMRAVRKVFESGRLVLGPEVEKFEDSWAQKCDSDYAIGVANGMDAIEIMLRSLGIGPGDEVITTTMSAFASVLGIVRAGATPVLADIDRETGLLSLESARRCLSSSTKAILVVHLYGQVRDMNHWVQFCEESEVLLLEDCAQAHMAKSGGTVAGNFGSAAAFSFYPTKNLGAFGDAGAIVTSNQLVAERSKILRNYGQSGSYRHSEFGLNSRLDEVQAAILNIRLSWLPIFTKKRQEIGKRYSKEISNPCVSILAPPLEEQAHVYHLFVVKTSERDSFRAHLRESGVHTNIHYPVPIHAQPPSASLRRDPRGLENSETYAQQILSLPCHPQMSDDDVVAVVDAVNCFRA